MKKIIIKLVTWDYQCADGCCFDYGQDIYLNDKQLNEITPKTTKTHLKPY